MWHQHDEVCVYMGRSFDDPTRRPLELQQIARLDAIVPQPFCELCEFRAGRLDLDTPEYIRGGVCQRDTKRRVRRAIQRALFGERRCHR